MRCWSLTLKREEEAERDDVSLAFSRWTQLEKSWEMVNNEPKEAFVPQLPFT